MLDDGRPTSSKNQFEEATRVTGSVFQAKTRTR